MKPVRLLLCMILVMTFYAPAGAVRIKIATWNIENLRAQDNEGDNPRTEADYKRLGDYAWRLDADIVALQEVEGEDAARRVFNPAEYRFFFSSRWDQMLTGFAVRKNLKVIRNPDYIRLNVTGGLRYGTDITVMVDGRLIRLLCVHLKSGCFDIQSEQQTNHKTRSACATQQEQVPILEEWIDARAAEEMPFIVLGDFNRRFDAPYDSFWAEIDDGYPPNADLSRVTEGRTSGCWGGEYPLYIDHIVLDLLASEWVVGDSFGQIVYQEGDQAKKLLSDHCPISVVLDVPPRGWK